MEQNSYMFSLNTTPIIEEDSIYEMLSLERESVLIDINKEYVSKLINDSNQIENLINTNVENLDTSIQEIISLEFIKNKIRRKNILKKLNRFLFVYNHLQIPDSVLEKNNYLNTIYTYFNKMKSKEELDKVKKFILKIIFQEYKDFTIRSQLKSFLRRCEEKSLKNEEKSIVEEVSYIDVKNEDKDFFNEYIDLTISVSDGKLNAEFHFIRMDSSQVQTTSTLELDDDINYLDLSTVDKKAIMCKVNLKSLYRLYNDYRTTLFEKNLRYFSRRETVDLAIIESLLKHGEYFHILHNGIAIVCDRFMLGQNNIIIDKPSVINGAQTISNIYNAVNENYISENELNNIYIVCKFISTDNSNNNDFIKEVSIAANTQKPIKFFESYVNEEDLIDLKEQLQKDKVFLILKNGEKCNQTKGDTLKILELAKVLKAAIYQTPGSAYNALSSKLFEENFEIFFKHCNDYPNKLQFIKLFLAIYFSWDGAKNKIDESEEKNLLKSYGRLYFVSYTTYKYLKNQVSSKLLNKSYNDMEVDVKKLLNNNFVNEFVESFIKGYKQIEEDYQGQKAFKKDDIYFKSLDLEKADNEFVENLKECYLTEGDKDDESC